MSTMIPYSAACERNQDVILATIRPYLKNINTVLEIGTGTAQHAVCFAKAIPSVSWQTSDRLQHLAGIVAQLDHAGVANVLPPLELDVTQPVWVPSGCRYQAIYTANTLHIMCEEEIHAFFARLPVVATTDAHLFIYGPFRYSGQFTSQSNELFDQSLRSRGAGSAIRDFELVCDLALTAGFSLLDDIAMPANNQCLIFARVS